MPQQKDRIKNAAESAAAESFFLRLLAIIADWFYKTFEASAIARFFGAPKNFEAIKRDSFFYRTFVRAPQILMANVKRFFAKQFENSVVCNAFFTLTDGFMNTSLRSYGIGFIVYGVSAALVGVFEVQNYNFIELISAKYAILLGFIIVGCVFSVYRPSLAAAIKESSIASFFIFSVVGLREQSFARFEKTSDRFVIAAALGAVFGAMTIKIPVYLLPGLAAGAICVAFVLASPEFGALTVMFALPFLPTMALALLCLFTFAAFFLKYLRGKRVFSFDGTMLFALLFAITQMISVFGAANKASSFNIVLVYFSFMLFAFVVANCFKTKGQVVKAVSVLLIAASISSLVGIYQHFVGVESSLKWVDTDMFESISTRVFGTFDNPNVFGEFLVMLMPLAIAAFIISRGRVKIAAAAGVAVMAASLVFTYSRGAWLAAIVSLIMFLCFYSKVFFKIGVAGLAAVPVLPFVLPSSIVERFTSIGNLADTSTNYRVSIWYAAIEMIKRFWIKGIGIGSDCFVTQYPFFALNGAQFALHSHNLFFQMIIEIGVLGFVMFLLMLIMNYRNVFSCFSHAGDKLQKFLILGLGAGVVAMLVQGLTDNVWYNLRIYLLFWLLIALTSGVAKGFRESEGDAL